MAPQIPATHHKENLLKALCVMEENSLLLHILEKKNEWDSFLIQPWPQINWDTHAVMTSGLLDS